MESSSEESLEEEDEPAFWHQDPPTDSRAFMSTILRGMKKIFRGQVRLRKQVEEQSSRLDRIKAGLQRSQSAGPSTTAVQNDDGGDSVLLPISCIFYLAHIEDNA